MKGKFAFIKSYEQKTKLIDKFEYEISVLTQKMSACATVLDIERVIDKLKHWAPLSRVQDLALKSESLATKDELS